MPDTNQDIHLRQKSALIQAAASITSVIVSQPKLGGRIYGSKNINRTRRSVQQIREDMGDSVFRKAYRMKYDDFWKLHHIVFKTDLVAKRKRGTTPNGDILNSHRLSMALRWFAGGCKFDIAPYHGVNPYEVIKSVWIVVDAINNCQQLKIKFPQTYGEQEMIAEGFRKVSSAKFDNCVGCIDCMLVWIDKPNKKEISKTKIGAKRFFSGRKKKFGMILQAVCDHNRKFVDVDISQPASTSDYLTFCTSKLLNDKLSKEGFLKNGFTLFGDNAYVNTGFMTTPFKSVSGGVLDAFNYYHSQVRINIECAFGTLIHRWGCLRKPIPVNISIAKVSSLVKCLCILHNFCIDIRLSEKDGESGNCIQPMIDDSTSIMTNGGDININLDRNSHNITPIFNSNSDFTTNERFTSLYDVGHHWDDCRSQFTRVNLARNQNMGNTMPRVIMLDHLEISGLTKRPKPFGSTSTNI
jgi:hypothetical protein